MGHKCVPCSFNDHGNCRDGRAMGSGMLGVTCECCYPVHAPPPPDPYAALFAEVRAEIDRFVEGERGALYLLGATEKVARVATDRATIGANESARQATVWTAARAIIALRALDREAAK